MSPTVIRPIKQHKISNIHLFLTYAYIRNTCMLEHVCCVGLITVDKKNRMTYPRPHQLVKFNSSINTKINPSISTKV